MSGAVQGTQQNRPIGIFSFFPSQEPKVPFLRDKVLKLASDIFGFIKRAFSYTCRGFSWAWGGISSLTESGKNPTDQVKDAKIAEKLGNSGKPQEIDTKIEEMSEAVQGTQPQEQKVPSLMDRVSKLASDVLAFIKRAFSYPCRAFSWAWSVLLGMV